MEDYTSRSNAPDSQDSNLQKQRLQKEFNRLDAAMNRFLDLYGDGRFSREMLDVKTDEITRQRRIIEKRIRSIDGEVLEGDEQEEALSNFEAFCSEIRAGLAELTVEERQQLLCLLVESVRIEAKNIRIEVVVPSVDPQADYRLRPKHSPRLHQYLCAA